MFKKNTLMFVLSCSLMSFSITAHSPVSSRKGPSDEKGSNSNTSLARNALLYVHMQQERYGRNNVDPLTGRPFNS